jgi:hypothetical protein
MGTFDNMELLGNSPFSLAIKARKCYITTNEHKIRHNKDRNYQLKNANGVFKQ